MAKRIKTAKKVGKQLAHLGKAVAKDAGQRVKRELKAVLEDHLMTKDEARNLAGTVLKELKVEADRFVTFAKQEYDREMKRAKPHLKRAATRLKKGRR